MMATTLAGAAAHRLLFCFGRSFKMTQPKWVLSTMLLSAMALPAQSFGGARLVQSAQHDAQSNHYYVQTAAKRKVVKRRSTKKSAAIVGGSALGGAAIGGLAAGKKGAAIGALAGGGGGYVYDRKSQKKPVIPK
jgi:hypothetical protein